MVVTDSLSIFYDYPDSPEEGGLVDQEQDGCYRLTEQQEQQQQHEL